MSFLSSLNISGSGLTAQKLRMDVISQNIANSQTTRTAAGGPYKRKVVVLQSTQEKGNFESAFNKAVSIAGEEKPTQVRTTGVKVEKIIEDQTKFVPVYNPNHPDANEEGYVMMPNVNTTQEMVDMLGASRAYEANVTAFNATKVMLQKALEIGR